MRRLALLVLLALAGCQSHASSIPASAKSAKGTAPAGRLPGDALLYRLADHASELHCIGVNGALRDAVMALHVPTQLPSPYSGQSGDDAFRWMELALSDTDVAAYAAGPPTKGRKPPKKETTPVRFDAVWNSKNGVYSSKTSLVLRAGESCVVNIPGGRGSGHDVLSFAATTLGADAAKLQVVGDGAPVSDTTAPTLRWSDVTAPVNARSLRFSVAGPPGALVYVGDPVVTATGAGAPGPNVVVILIDTLRADALPVMPRLSALAARGARFDQAITGATWTRPSLLTFLGGDAPSALAHSAEEMIPTDEARRLFYTAAPPLLPRLLAARGWRTFGIGNNFFLLGYPQIGLSLGLDEVTDIRHLVLDTPAIARGAVAFFAAHARESFYLQLHFDAPHWPYTPPAESLVGLTIPDDFPDDSLAKRYLGEAAYADQAVGQIVDALDRLHLSERTYVVVFGDHGEIFDHAHAHTVEALQLPTLHHHGWSAYDEILRVPLIVVGPHVPSVRVAEQVRLADVLPTLGELLGGATFVDGKRSGRSLVPLFSGHMDNRPAFVEGQNVRALRQDGWLYLRRRDGRLRDERNHPSVHVEELYDLAKDPEQHVDLVADPRHQAILTKLRADFARRAPTLPEVPHPVVHLRVDPASRAHLIEGTIRAAGKLFVQKIAGGEVRAVDASTLAVHLREGALLDLRVEPPDAAISFALQQEGIPIDARALLLGRYGLPLLAAVDVAQPAAYPVEIAADQLSWLDAVEPPVLAHEGGVLVWRDPSRLSALTTATAEGNSEVAGMMRKWGYSQPGK